MTDLAKPNRMADALRAQYGRKASESELQVFAAAAQHLGLSVPAGEIALVPYANVNNIQITIEGRRTIAQRTGRLRGIHGPAWCGPRQYDTDGEKLPLDWEEVWTGTGMPYAARVLIAVDGWDTPANGTCKYDEFHQPQSPVWRKYPSHMLGIAAEKLALRRGFSAEIGKALADLADITGDWQTVDDDTGEINPGEIPGPGVRGEAPPGPDPLIAAADRMWLLDRLAWHRDHQPDTYQWLRDTWKAFGGPALNSPEMTADDGRRLRALIQRGVPTMSGPAPAGGTATPAAGAPPQPAVPAGPGTDHDDVPDDVYDDMPEAVDADMQPGSYANPDADPGRPFDD